jgi:hypothetical protein
MLRWVFGPKMPRYIVCGKRMLWSERSTHMTTCTSCECTNARAVEIRAPLRCPASWRRILNGSDDLRGAPGRDGEHRRRRHEALLSDNHRDDGGHRHGEHGGVDVRFPSFNHGANIGIRSPRCPFQKKSGKREMVAPSGSTRRKIRIEEKPPPG